MKTKRLFGSIFAGVCAVGAIVGLTSCKKSDDPNGDDPVVDTSEEDLAKVEAALNGLSVAEVQNKDFTLPTSAAGGVAISWASSNTDVIKVTGGDAKVTRPSFTAEKDAEVTLTATAVAGTQNKAKEFKVKVEKLVDESKTVAEIKALSDNTAVYARGVVTGFLYAYGTTDPEYKAGFYLTDATGTIYVYGDKVAKEVSVGNEVYFAGSKASYSSAAQISNPTELQVIKEEATADWTAIIDDKTIAEVVAEGKNAIGNVYEFTGKIVQIKAATYVNYRIEDLTDSSKYINIYVTGSGSVNPNNLDAYEFDDVFEAKANQIAKVRFVINSSNSSGTIRGNVLAVLPFSAAEQEEYIEDAVKSAVALDNLITEDTELELPTAIDGFDKVTISWSLKTGSTGAVLDETGKLTVTPTEAIQSFTLIATISIDGVDEDKEVEVGPYKACTSFDPVSNGEFVAAENGTKMFVQGTIIAYKNGQGVVIQDAEGFGYYIYDTTLCKTAADFAVGGKYAPGTIIKVYGEKDVYNGLHQLKSITSIEIIEGGSMPTPKDMEAAVDSGELDDYLSTYVTIEQAYYDGANFVTPAGNVIAYYNQFGISDVPEAGKVYNVVGIVGHFNKFQLQPLELTEVIESVNAKFVKFALSDLFEESYSDNATVVVPDTLYGYSITYSLGTSETVTYDDATHTVTITVSKSETTELSFTVAGTDPVVSGVIQIVVDLSQGTDEVDFTTKGDVYEFVAESSGFAFNLKDSKANKDNLTDADDVGSALGFTAVNVYNLQYGGTATRVWKASSGVVDFRIYTNSELLFVAKEGLVIKSVTFGIKSGTNYKIKDEDGEDVTGVDKKFTFENGTNSFSFVAGATIQINSISIDYEVVA